jgi:hypothetical protein
MSSTSGTAAAIVYAPLWNDGEGWDLTECYSTIQAADINADGKAELIGRFRDLRQFLGLRLHRYRGHRLDNFQAP